MESNKLEASILEIVCKLFEDNNKDMSQLSIIKALTRKCLEVSLRQINLIVTEFFDNQSSLEPNSQDPENITPISLMKKHLKKIDNTIENYYSNTEEIEKSFFLNNTASIAPSIIENLMNKLESISRYAPDFILNIRDISKDTWKETLDFEKIIQNQRKSYEKVITALETKFRNRSEHIKYKSALKIIKFENTIEKITENSQLSNERNFMIINDLFSKLIENNNKEEELNGLVKKLGFKDKKLALKNLKNFDVVKLKYQNQVDALQKEIKNIKSKLVNSNKALDEIKPKFEKNEENIKEIEAAFTKVLEISALGNAEKKKILGLVGEKNFNKIEETLKSFQGEKLEKIEKFIEKNEKYISKTERNVEKTDKINEKPIEKNEKLAMRSLARNETEIKNISSTKPSKNAQILEKTNSKPKIEESKGKSFITEPNSNIKKNVKSSRIMRKEESLSPVKIPNVKTENEIKNVVQKAENPENFEDLYEKDKYLNESLQNENLPLKRNNVIKKHRKSLEPPRPEKILPFSPKSQPPGSYKNLKSSFNSAISTIFSNHFSKSPQSPSNLDFLNSMSTEEILNIKLSIGNQTKTIQELIVEGLESQLKSEKKTILLNLNNEPQKLNKIYEEGEPEKNEKKKKNENAVGWKNSALKLFVILEDYLENLEGDEKKPFSVMIYEKIAENKQDDIVNFIKNSENPEKEIKEISELMIRSKKYDLLHKIYGIPKKGQIEDWKSHKINMVNKVRWSNLISKIKSREIKMLQTKDDPKELLFKLALEIRNHKFTLKNIVSSESLVKKRHRHNFSMENIAINELKSSHDRHISLNHKGLNYFLPYIQKTPRAEKSFQMTPSSILFSDMWVKNSNKKLL